MEAHTSANGNKGPPIAHIAHMRLWAPSRRLSLGTERKPVAEYKVSRAAIGALATGAFASGARAIGTLSVGVFGLGAFFLGRLSIGRVAVRNARIRALEIDDLRIARYRAPRLANKGIVDRPSNYSVDRTVERLKEILRSKDVTLFALIDHSGEAQKAGMKMPPTKLLIFGSPKAGTPLMQAAPSIALDLPLKLLVWEDPHGKTWISYNSAEYLKERHELPEDLFQGVAVTEALALKAGE